MVRFGRRAKRRPKTEPNTESPDQDNVEEPVQAAVDTLSDTLDEVFTSTESIEASSEITSALSGRSDKDPTQQLLTSLGRFQRELKGVRAGVGSDDWSDECMNQLLHSAEVALGEGWADLVTALSDTGRVLQSYENAGKANESLNFLDEGYEVLCLMVGDLISDNIRDSVRDRWKEVYERALVDMESARVTLIDDDAENVVVMSGDNIGELDDNGQGDDMPFEMPAVKEMVISDDSLPTLDELPPLESLLTVNKGMGTPAAFEEKTAKDALVENAPEEELELLQAFKGDEDSDNSIAEELNPLETNEVPPVESANEQGPSRIVVDIMDRICDELGKLESLSAGARPVGLETIVGGVTALQQCVHGAHQDELDSLCDAMLSACRLLDGREADLDDRFTELGFAFCGVYVEAMEDGMCENVRAWNDECAEWVEAHQVAPVVESVEAEGESQIAPLTEDGVAEIVQPDVSISYKEEVFQPYTSENVETIEVSNDSTIVEQEVVEESSGEIPGDLSSQLLESAQAAALKGDSAGAKVFALQAAVNIAKQEVIRAEVHLEQAEVKLKSTLSSVDTARGKVSVTEGAVKDAAEMVGAGEECHEEVKQESAGVAEELEALEAGVADLNHKIQELQAQRDAELEKVNETITRQEKVHVKEQDALTELQILRGDEDAARKKLEADRQVVKDLQRQISDIETEMESARDRLTNEKVSMADISQTIQQLLGGEPKDNTATENDGMLF